jgi:hypothetical protein
MQYIPGLCQHRLSTADRATTSVTDSRKSILILSSLYSFDEDRIEDTASNNSYAVGWSVKQEVSQRWRQYSIQEYVFVAAETWLQAVA